MLQRNIGVGKLQVVEDASLPDPLDHFADIQAQAYIDGTFPVIIGLVGVVVIISAHIVAQM
jgi:hypothetical protein